MTFEVAYAFWRVPVCLGYHVQPSYFTHFLLERKDTHTCERERACERACVCREEELEEDSRDAARNRRRQRRRRNKNRHRRRDKRRL